MFDSRSEFAVEIMSGGEKRCTLQYPTDAMWCAVSRKRRVVESFLGRRKSQSRVVGGEAATAELFTKIRLDSLCAGRDEFDEAEACAAIDKLSRCQVLSCEREGNAYRVTMRVYAGMLEHEGQLRDAYQRVEHILRIPLQADSLAYSRAAVPPSTDGPNSREIRVYLEPSAEFWAKIGTAASGYAEGSSVPIVHKDSAIIALRQALDVGSEDDDPEA